MNILKAALRLLKRKSKKFPHIITLNEFGKPLRFQIYNEVERFRTAKYGGEIEFFREFIQQLREDDVIYDVGASVGLFSVHAAKAATKGQVVAIEPDPETSSRLKKNLALNNLTNSRVENWAAGDIPGSTVLHTDGSAGFAPTLRFQEGRKGAPKGKVNVEIKTIDSFVASGSAPLPDVLKIDIEGAETQCLKGAKKLLEGELGKRPRLIAIEVHPEFLPSFDSSAAEVLGLLEQYGYSAARDITREQQDQYFFVPQG